MKVQLKTPQLQEILDITSKFVSKHSTLPILENIYIKTNIDSIIFRATDMEKYVEVELPATIQAEGAITVNARTFTDIIKTIDEESIELVVDQNKDIITLKTPSDNFKIKGISANEYVAVPEVSKDNTLTIDATSFIKGISKVEFAVTEKNFSPVLTGVLVRIKKIWEQNTIIFVGTDGFRLAEYKLPFTGKGEEMSIIIPKTNINDIKKLAEYFSEKGGSELQMSFSENLVSFSFDLGGVKMMATSLLIHGNFPDYENENIMPTKFSTKVIIDKNSTEKAIRKISILTKDINNYIVMDITNNKVDIHSGETDKGEANTTSSALVEGDEVKLWINGKHVADFIRLMDSNELVYNIVNPEKPAVLEDKNDTNYKYIIRPLVK